MKSIGLDPYYILKLICLNTVVEQVDFFTLKAEGEAFIKQSWQPSNNNALSVCTVDLRTSYNRARLPYVSLIRDVLLSSCRPR